MGNEKMIVIEVDDHEDRNYMEKALLKRVLKYSKTHARGNLTN